MLICHLFDVSRYERADKLPPEWRALYDDVERTCKELEAAEQRATDARRKISDAVEGIYSARSYIVTHYGNTSEGAAFHAEWKRMKAARKAAPFSPAAPWEVRRPRYSGKAST